jgi:hypothetical protein
MSSYLARACQAAVVRFAVDYSSSINHNKRQPPDVSQKSSFDRRPIIIPIVDDIPIRVTHRFEARIAGKFRLAVYARSPTASVKLQVVRCRLMSIFCVDVVVDVSRSISMFTVDALFFGRLAVGRQVAESNEAEEQLVWQTDGMHQIIINDHPSHPNHRPSSFFRNVRSFIDSSSRKFIYSFIRSFQSSIILDHSFVRSLVHDSRAVGRRIQASHRTRSSSSRSTTSTTTKYVERRQRRSRCVVLFCCCVWLFLLLLLLLLLFFV